jgi:hypothetical protein
MSVFVACLLAAALALTAISFAVLASAIWRAREGEEDESGCGPGESHGPPPVPERSEPTAGDRWHSRLSVNTVRTLDSGLAMSIPRRSVQSSHRPACRRTSVSRHAERA